LSVFVEAAAQRACKNTPFERTVVKLPGSHFFAGSVLQDQTDQEIISVRAWRPAHLSQRREPATRAKRFDLRHRR